MTVRAKFWVSSINRTSPTSNEIANVATIVMHPVFGDGDEPNADWSKYTPTGKIEMTITNPDAIDQFDLGGEYYVDFRACKQDTRGKASRPA